MKIGVLLEELISIAQIPKTDFALSMNMTPSGLSKILTGRRLPFAKEKKPFSWQAAKYFSQAIYGRNCYLKFKNIFPVIYDFNSAHELELFLAYAIEYSLDRAFEEENNTNLGYSDTELCFLGKKNILNMLCIIVSDYMISHDANAPLEFYSAPTFFSRPQADILQRMKLLGTNRAITFNHFFDMATIEAAASDESTIDFLEMIVQAQEYVDLNLWQITKPIDSTFLLLKGKFLLLFSTQIDGTPLMSFITHKGYLPSFFNTLMKKDAKKVSFNRNESIAYLEANPSCIEELIGRQIDAVYNFISIGYLLNKEELEAAQGSSCIKESVLQLFHSVLTQETAFYVTVDAMVHFYVTGKAIVPLLGAVDVAPHNRIPYLRRFESHIDERSTNKIKIVNSDLPKAAVLCARGLSVIYSVDQAYRVEKIHYFETDMINNMLHGEIVKNPSNLLDFSPDLWDGYIGELSSATRI